MVDLAFQRRALALPVQIFLLERLLIRVVIPSEVQQLLPLTKVETGKPGRG